MKLYKTKDSAYVEISGEFFSLGSANWDDLVNSDNVPAAIEAAKQPDPDPGFSATDDRIVAPIASQEVWAAGVTYYRSRTARMEESEEAGGGSFYDRVYDADRPEIFPKSNVHRTVGPGQNVRIRADSEWNVPEPELTPLLNNSGKVVGYTVGNDMSSRDIEGENPLYLPQGKIWDGSCALGPCVLVEPEPLPPSSAIELTITRGGEVAFSGDPKLEQLKRTVPELAGYLFRECSFPHGCFLMTGTGIVPPNEFTLQSGDTIRISIDGIGTLENSVA